MYLIQFLKSLICGVLRFVRTLLTTLFWRVPGSYLGLPYIRQINMEFDYECDCDSTWEDERENKQQKPRTKIYRRSDRNTYAAKDMQNFRHSVRNLDDDDGLDKPGEGRFYNLEFYHGHISSSPDDVYIDEFHKKWWGDYRSLENCHSYIQWLFPIQERGVNWDAHVLTKKEIKLFREDEEAKRKLVKSYKLMLDFYGICLVNETTGEVERANNWKERFSNLNRYSHNNLRITRILKCLGTLGLQHYQAPLVKFFLHETLVEGYLQRVKQSVLDYFMFAVLDKSDRRELVRFAFKNFKPREQFVWGPKKFLSGEVDEQDLESESVKKNQKVSVGDAKKSGEVQSENENLNQPTENKDNSTHEGNQIDDRNHDKEMLNEENGGKDQLVKTSSNKNNEDKHDANENSQSSSINKTAVKQDPETNDSNEETRSHNNLK